MPNPLPTKESEAFGNRLVALLAHREIERHGAGAYLAVKYGVSGVTANAWLDGLHKCSSARARAIAKDHGCTFESLYVGPKLVYLDAGDSEKPVTGAPAPSPYLGREVMEHLEALGISQGLLVKVLAESIPAAGRAFLSELRRADPHVRRLEHVKVLRAALEKEFPSQAQHPQRTASRKPGEAARQK